MNKTITGLLSVFAIIGWTETTLAESYTGCVTPGGTIIHLAIGQSPLKPCAKKHNEIHLDKAIASQQSGAHYDQATLCKALHEAEGISPGTLSAMNCHIEKNAPTAGTLQRIKGYHIESKYPSDCPLQLKQDPDRWGIGWHWVLQAEGKTTGGTYVAKPRQILNVAEPDGTLPSEKCKQLCDEDEECVGAIYNNPLRSDTLLRECRTFHYSDAMPETWNEWCGDLAGTVGCSGKLHDARVIWWTRSVEQCGD